MFLSRQLIKSVSMLGAEKWLNRLHLIIDKHLDNPSLDNQQLAEALDISERHLFRKIKTLTTLPPQRYLSQYRLHKAMNYLKNGRYRTVKETSFAVGFRNPSYFIRQFEKEFDRRPLQILEEAGWR